MLPTAEVMLALLVLADAAIQAGFLFKAMPYCGQRLGPSDSTPENIGQKYFAAEGGVPLN